MLKSSYYEDPNIIECGLDEAGAGCLCGPVTAAAVIWPKDLELCKELEILDDSKKMTEKKRNSIIDFIKENAIEYSITFISNKKIDEINILNSRILAMHKCIDKLQTNVDLLLVDGNRFKTYKTKDGHEIEYKTIIKGDATYQSIAAASVLAKCARDKYMVTKIHKEIPDYGVDKHKGYPTSSHKEVIKEKGVTKYHRLTFKGCKEYVNNCNDD
jgi:ribonuclease HII